MQLLGLSELEIAAELCADERFHFGEHLWMSEGKVHQAVCRRLAYKDVVSGAKLEEERFDGSIEVRVFGHESSDLAVSDHDHSLAHRRNVRVQQNLTEFDRDASPPLARVGAQQES